MGRLLAGLVHRKSRRRKNLALAQGEPGSPESGCARCRRFNPFFSSRFGSLCGAPSSPGQPAPPSGVAGRIGGCFLLPGPRCALEGRHQRKGPCGPVPHRARHEMAGAETGRRRAPVRGPLRSFKGRGRGGFAGGGPSLRHGSPPEESLLEHGGKRRRGAGR